VLEGVLNLAWKYVLREHFPEPMDDPTGVLSPESNNRNSKESFPKAIELFLQRSIQPGGDFQVRKDLGTSAIDHRHRFDKLLRVAELLPAGDIMMPNESLTLEWFYMTFHKSERDQFIMSGRRLAEETIESITEYFESLYNVKKSSGKLQKQLEHRDHRRDEARGSIKSKYDDKLRSMADEHRTSRSRTYRDDRNRDRGYKTSRDSEHKRDKSERKAPPEFAGKPCHIHGDKARHTYENCRGNPKNRKSSDSNRYDNNKKCSHNAHHHDERYLSSQDESPEEHRTPEPSDDEGELSGSSGESHRKEENYRVDTGKVPQKKRKVDVPRRSATHKNPRNEKPSHSTKHVTDSLLQEELDATTHEKQISDDVTNPFDFK